MKNLKLNAVTKNQINSKQMSEIKGGGGPCYCGCNGPSSTNANGGANADGNLTSPGGGKLFYSMTVSG